MKINSIYSLLRTVLAAGMVMAFVLPTTGCGGSDEKPSHKPPVIIDPKDPKDPEDPEDPNIEPSVTLRIVDSNATPETKALMANLWRLQNEGKYMFGHHDDLLYGHAWNWGQANESTNKGSDTRAVCGEYPAVFSLDFATMIDNRRAGDTWANNLRIAAMKDAYARGEVITACIHINNPRTLGDSWTPGAEASVWPDIIQPGSNIYNTFISWLDNLADMANNLKDNNGTLIPVLFRPFHEHTQSWSWWQTNCTSAQFIELWQMTIKYLRDTKGVHNFLYAISPQIDSYSNANTTRDRILYRWMGDEWVDFLGMDCYHGSNYSSLTNNLVVMDQVSQEKMKPCGVTETGLEGIATPNPSGTPVSAYWTNGVVTPFNNRKVSMVVMWRNETGSTHFFSVWPGHASEGSFMTMYNNANSVFGNALAGGIMYKMPKGYAVKGY